MWLFCLALSIGIGIGFISNQLLAEDRIEAGRPPPWLIALSEKPIVPLLIGKQVKLYMADDLALLKPDAVSTLLDQGGGITLNSHDAEITRVKHPIWAKFQLQNNTVDSVDLVLDHAQPTIEVHQAFIRSSKTGDWKNLRGRHELAKTAFERDREPTYDLRIAPSESVEVLFRWVTFSPVKAPVEIKTREQHDKATHLQISFYTAFLMTPLLVLFALVLVKRIGQISIDGLFVSFVLADMVGASWITGFMPILFPTADPALLRQIGHIGYALLALLSAFHAIKFLRLKTLCPRWACCLRLWASVGAIAAIGLSFYSLHLDADVVLIYAFGTSVLVTGTCLYALLRKAPFAGVYTLAWSVYILTLVVYLLYRLEYLPVAATGFAYFGQSAGVCIILGSAIIMSVYSSDTRLKDALLLADKRRRQLETLNAERDKLFAIASHDLRQPLQAISLNLGLLNLEKPSDGAITERIRLAVVGMNDILASLLDLRRASNSANALSETNLNEANQGANAASRVELQPMQLQPLLDRLCEDYREQARMKRLSFRNVPTKVWVLTDPIWLERVLRNLITNALRYTDQGRVLLGVRQQRNGTVKICIIDTGRGITVAQLEQINAHELAAPNPELRDSYGLGLYIVKRLCAQMRARLVVKSEIGKGSIFEITLPQSEISKSSESKNLNKTLVGTRILIADDDVNLLTALARHLRNEGAIVITATSASQAISAIYQQPLDTVLSDYRFAEESVTGLDVLAHCPDSIDRYLMSGDLEQIRLSTHSIGLAAKKPQFVAKPFDLQQITAILTARTIDFESGHKE
jgi:signal transduction histidine kinase/ActR/RegA family two-component response regulator